MLCHIHRLGRISYEQACNLQREICARRLDGLVPDSLLLVEHPPTITIGKSGKLDNILVPGEELNRMGVSLFFTDRGGDVTYHGPGQLVAYPIIDLRQRAKNIHAYVRDLEEVVLRTLGEFSIAGSRNSHAGVWVGDRQISAIGIAVKRWIAMHGISLNVHPDHAHFNLINPCGLDGVRVTSIHEMTGRDIPMEQVTNALVASFAEVFGAIVEDEVAAAGVADGR